MLHLAVFRHFLVFTWPLMALRPPPLFLTLLLSSNSYHNFFSSAYSLMSLLSNHVWRICVRFIGESGAIWRSGRLAQLISE
jgi:hypothetical protein